VRRNWFFFLFILLIETGSHYVARVALNSRSSCLSLPSAGITGKKHQAWLPFTYFISLENHEVGKADGPITDVESDKTVTEM
jgi:hypothetical protein